MKSVSEALKEASERMKGLVIKGPSGSVAFKATNGLTVAVGAEDELSASLRRYGLAVGLDCEAVERAIGGKNDIFSMLPIGMPLKRAVEPHIVVRMTVGSKKKAKEPVAKVAMKALSTWDFSSKFVDRVVGTKVHLVGQHHRDKRDNEVLGWKRQGNMALLVAEPDNPVDINAVMVLMWDDTVKEWRHVGYVRRKQAALLRGKWTGDYRNVMVARITAKPVGADGHRDGRNIELTLTGELRTYPGYLA